MEYIVPSLTMIGALYAFYRLGYSTAVDHFINALHVTVEELDNMYSDLKENK